MSSRDRLAVLRNQLGVVADDEIRFHLNALEEECRLGADFPPKQVVMLDPISLLQHGLTLCPLIALTGLSLTRRSVRMAFSLLEPLALINIGFLSSSPHREKMFELPRLMHRGNCMLSLLAF